MVRFDLVSATFVQKYRNEICLDGHNSLSFGNTGRLPMTKAVTPVPGRYLRLHPASKDVCIIPFASLLVQFLLSFQEASVS